MSGKEKLKGKTSFASNCSRVMISENIPLVQNIFDYHVESAIYLFLGYFVVVQKLFVQP